MPKTDRKKELQHSGRDRCVSEVIDGLDHDVWHGGAEPAAIFEQATAAVDALVDAALLFPAERWDEDCHSCEQPIRDHFVDGRCPPTTESEQS